MPIAENCWVMPGGREVVAGLTAREVRVAPLTVRVVDLVIEPY